MFSIKGDTVLDPFLGSGTTTKIALQNERNSIGYELDSNLLPVITQKTGDDRSISVGFKVIKR